MKLVALILFPLLLLASPNRRRNPIIHALASFTMARVVVKEKVGSPIRDAVEGTELEELAGCTRCVGTWSALLLWVLPERFSQVLAVAGLNFWLQGSFTGLTEKVNQLQETA